MGEHWFDALAKSLAPGLSAVSFSLDLELAALRDRPALLIFWNPACHFGQKILPDVQALEAMDTSDRPDLIPVSAGTVEANRAMRLRSTIVVDQGFRVGSVFGAGGTPMAVLLNGDGTIGSDRM